jgi:hypothetical protein
MRLDLKNAVLDPAGLVQYQTELPARPRLPGACRSLAPVRQSRISEAFTTIRNLARCAGIPSVSSLRRRNRNESVGQRRRLRAG